MARREKYKFPKPTIERLSYYFRALEDLSKRGIDTVSSDALGTKLNIKSSQIRRDLSYFGDFGKRGMGYDVKFLLKELRYILGLDREWPTIVIGAGNFGTAMAHYSGFKKRGFDVKAMFDIDKDKVGSKENKVPTLHMNDLDKFIKENKIEIAMICVPETAAQEVTDQLIKNGVNGILNFAPIALKHDKEIRCLSVDLTTKLEAIAYYMSYSKDKLWKIFS
ncbi:MAG: redox-sensing transcriptional repressor Rex [bacterium]